MKFLTALVNGLDWLNRKILAVCRILTIFLVAIITLNVFAGVFWRYVLNDSIPWYEESAKYLMLWMVFTACPIVLKQRGHIALDILPRWLTPRLQNFNYLIIYTIVLFLVGVFVWQGADLAWFARRQQPTSVDISFFWIYVSIPFGCAVMALVSLEYWLRALRGIFSPDDTDLTGGDMVDTSMS